MGSSSKKVKSSKETRKRRHRSRSISEEETKERERHRHRKHHSHRERRHEKRHKEYESEESSGQPPSPPQIHNVESSPEHSRSGTPPQNDHRSAESLSIDETNKLRAKLGLKPLEVASSHSRDNRDAEERSDGKLKDDLGEFYHKPAISLAEKAKQEKLRYKLAERKEKRKLESKLMKIRMLGDSESDEDAANWVEKNRKIQMEKQQAAKRAKMLEELDAEFGVGEIIESETKLKRAKIYGDKHLKGLRVEHNPEHFVEGKNVILTLKDADVLAEDDDVLINVNMIDDERYNKSNEIKKKKPGYQAYDDEEYDCFGNLKPKTLLGKYDEEIDGVKKDSFTIGQNTAAEHRKLAQSVKEKLSHKRLESLILPELNLASEYYTEEEMVKFKKPKKKIKKMRQKHKVLSAAELAANLKEENIGKDLGSRRRSKYDIEQYEPSGSKKMELTDWMDIDDVPEMKASAMDDLKLEPDDTTLERALRKARRLKQRENLTSLPTVASLLKDEPMEDISAQNDTGNIILNSTAEFCRTLGDIPTYGRSGNRDEEKDLVDFEGEIKLSPPSSPIAARATNAWNPVDPMDVVDTLAIPPEAPILDEEPDVGSGVGAALKLAMSKGYLDKEENNRPSTSRFAHLQAKHYSIEDKTYGDDDKFGGGNRHQRHNGPTQDFKERDGFRPNVKLEYIDDDGRVLNAKEAFRYLSHKFHGKGPGKNKIEKRIKKSDQEVLMKKMSSTDTPLGTLNMLQHKQKEMQSAFIVLSGSKHTHSTSISKARR